MAPSRRKFLQSLPVPIALSASTMTACAAETAAPSACLDYGTSFVCNTAEFNAVRFWIESRTVVYDDRNDTSEVFYQCGSCKSENTFAEKDLFMADNYDFLPVLGGSDWLIFRRPCRLSDDYRRVQHRLWGDPNLKLRYAKRVDRLESFAAIRDATADGAPLVAQTEIHDEKTGLRAMIEYPVKTMNVSLEKSVYQVDTGPVVYPDLTQRYPRIIDSLRLAFVAFNAWQFADFIVEQPTPVIHEGHRQSEVYHYSQPFSLPATNRLLGLAVD